MENQTDEEIHRVKAAAFKNTVEELFLSIERKAKEDPEKAENGKVKKFHNMIKVSRFSLNFSNSRRNSRAQ